MDNKYRIRLITAQETHAVRHPVLRNGRPISTCVFEGDNDKNTLHYGAFENKKLVGVLSAYLKNHPELKGKKSYQIRGVGVLIDYQKKGIGQALMKHFSKQIKSKEPVLIWLNARSNAVPFYNQLGYHIHGDSFSVPLIGLHYCCYRYV